MFIGSVIVNRKQVKYEPHLLNVYLLCGNLTDVMKRVDLIWDKGATHYTMDRTILNYCKIYKKYCTWYANLNNIYYPINIIQNY